MVHTGDAPSTGKIPTKMRRVVLVMTLPAATFISQIRETMGGKRTRNQTELFLLSELRKFREAF